MRRLRRTKNAVAPELQRQVKEAVLFTAFKYWDAYRRFARHQHRHGYDRECVRLADEAALSKSLLVVLLQELAREGGAQPA
jgi:hypothetical protein